MIARYTHGSLTWIDLESPTQDEVRLLMDEFSLDPLIAEELLDPTLRPRVEVHNNHFYLVLHFPAVKHSYTTSSDQEIDFIVSRDWIITTRYDTSDPLHNFSKLFEVNSILEKDNFGEHAGFIFFHMLTKLYQALGNELEYVRDRLESAEENIFEGKEKQMVIELSYIGRDILNLRQALEPHRDVLASLEGAALSVLGESFKRNVRTIIGEYYRVQKEVDAHSASLHELRETNNALLNTKQNEIMRIFTILAFLTLPLSLIAATFGMNVDRMPLVGHENGFWMVIGIMVLAMLTMFGYFKYKEWL